jgi:16S rRNA (uracil1498-N3)-methyltransferase
VGEIVPFPREEASHARSRRLKPGDAIILIDGTGREADAEIVADALGSSRVRVLAVRQLSDADAGPDVWLGIAGIRGERLSWVAEKAGELGVSCIALLRTERTQAFRAADATIARMERLVRAAAKQSGAARWPRCEGPMDLEAALAAVPEATRFILDVSGTPFPPRLRGRHVALLVGPEGGWTERELSSAAAAGWNRASLPAGILRAETAAIGAVVLARAALRYEMPPL